MERSLAEELYSEIQKPPPPAEMDPKPFLHNAESNSIDNDDDDLWYDDDDASNDVGFEKLENGASDIDREWQRRHDQFHTIGYPDGLIAGKEASAQEGFNIGFKESFFVGHRWGLVRGVTSALGCLPDGLKIKLVEEESEEEKLKEFQDLQKSIHALSTNDVLKSFHDNGLKDNNNNNQSSDTNIMENHVAKFKSLVSGSSFADRLQLEKDLLNGAEEQAAI